MLQSTCCLLVDINKKVLDITNGKHCVCYLPSITISSCFKASIIGTCAIKHMIKHNCYWAVIFILRYNKWNLYYGVQRVCYCTQRSIKGTRVGHSVIYCVMYVFTLFTF